MIGKIFACFLLFCALAEASKAPYFFNFLYNERFPPSSITSETAKNDSAKSVRSVPAPKSIVKTSVVEEKDDDESNMPPPYAWHSK